MQRVTATAPNAPDTLISPSRTNHEANITLSAANDRLSQSLKDRNGASTDITFNAPYSVFTQKGLEPCPVPEAQQLNHQHEPDTDSPVPADYLPKGKHDDSSHINTGLTLAPSLAWARPFKWHSIPQRLSHQHAPHTRRASDSIS
jgi:hypothetical protein